MNSQNGTNDIHTNLPSLDEIKAGNITNINFVEGTQGQSSDRLTVRMKMNGEKEKQTNFILKDYTDGVLNETQLILDAVNQKQFFSELKANKLSIINNEGRIDGLGIKQNRKSLVFVINLVHGENKINTTRNISNSSFEECYYKMINEYIEFRNTLCMNKLKDKDIISLSSSVEYYRNIYKEKSIEKAFKEAKSNLIESGLISEEGVILGIKNDGELMCYESNINGKIITRKISHQGYDEIINQFITTFVIQNNLELGGAVWKWLQKSKYKYSQYHTKSQKNSNVG